jgi:hypothetical protein
MIYNLVEAAQEFLSEHVRSNLLHAHEVLFEQLIERMIKLCMLKD